MLRVGPRPEYDAFLSYSRVDSAWASRLKTSLEDLGLKVWMDAVDLRPGDLFPTALANAIERSATVIVVLSPEALASVWVEREYSQVLSASGKRLIPVLLKTVELPGFLRIYNAVDFRDPERFPDSLRDLYFGITGKRIPVPAQIDPEPVPAPRSARFRPHYIFMTTYKEKVRKALLGAIGMLILGLLGCLVLLLPDIRAAVGETVHARAFMTIVNATILSLAAVSLFALVITAVDMVVLYSLAKACTILSFCLLWCGILYLFPMQYSRVYRFVLIGVSLLAGYWLFNLGFAGGYWRKRSYGDALVELVIAIVFAVIISRPILMILE
jgi:hypothetical protein